MSDAAASLTTQIESIILKAVPNITEDVKVGLKDEFNRFFESNLTKEKNATVTSVKEIASATSDALIKLKKELKEAEEEIASKEKDVTTAFANAMADWTKAMNLTPELTQSLLMIPQIKVDAISLVDTYNKLKEEMTKMKKDNHTIAVNAVNLIIIITSLVVGLITALIPLIIWILNHMA